nr:BPSL0067 family protein [Methylocapsa sp. RX1]
MLGSALFYLPLAISAGFVGLAWADPAPVTQNGVPLQVVPTFKETGAPSFSFPTGSDSTQGGTGGGTTGGTGGTSDGGGYNGGGGNGTGTLATNYSSLVGQSVGSGECVALVQATSNVGLTATWSPGQQVQGNTDIPVGSVIATFGSDGTYTNTYSQSHAAIYLGQDSTGILVEDQWLNHPASTRVIPWTTSNSYESGSQFYVVSHG